MDNKFNLSTIFFLKRDKFIDSVQSIKTQKLKVFKTLEDYTSFRLIVRKKDLLKAYIFNSKKNDLIKFCHLNRHHEKSQRS